MTEEAIRRLAATMLDFTVPAECLAGVAANLAALAEHARRIGEDE